MFRLDQNTGMINPVQISNRFFNSCYTFATNLIAHFPKVVLSDVFDASASEKWFVVQNESRRCKIWAFISRKFV